MKNMLRPIAAVLLLIVCGCNTDDDGLSNTPPAIQAQSFSASEAVSDSEDLGTVVASDADGDDLSFSIETNDNNLFEVTTAGVLSLAPGQTLDFEDETIHTITVSVSDGQSAATADITINVIDVDENTAPVINDQAFTLSENAGPVDFLQVVASDMDGDALTFTITMNSDDIFNITDDGLLSVSSGINPSFNFEVKPVHSLIVEVSDGTLNASATITINLEDANALPSVAVFNETFTVAEDIADDVVIGNFNATDEDGDALTYAITSNVSVSAGVDLFEINSTTGDISLTAVQSLDFETATTHTITLEISDGQGQINPTAVINVTDVNESPVTVTTLAGGDTGGVPFDISRGIAVDANGDILVAVNSNNVIRKVTPTGTVTTLSLADIAQPWGIAVDNDGVIYVGNSSGNRGSVIDAHTPDASGAFTSALFVSGGSGFADGTATDALFNLPYGMTFDSEGSLYVADRNNHAIRKVTKDRVVTTFAGMGGVSGNDDGNGTAATFSRPYDIAIDGQGSLYVADFLNHSIRKVTASGEVTTFIGGTRGDMDGMGTAAQISFPTGICFDSNDNLYIAELNGNIKKINITSATVTTLVNIPTSSNGLNNLEINKAGTELYVTTPDAIVKVAFE